MKNALLISGYLRGFIENINNIQKNIIQENECDIYIHITEDDENDKYLNKKISVDTISTLLKPKILIISKNFRFSSNVKINNILNQNYKKYWLNEELKKICLIENFKYDLIVLIRPDINIKTQLIYQDFLNKIYIPIDSKIDIDKLQNKNDKYICDIIAYGNPIMMNEYFNYYLEVSKLIDLHGTNVNETLLYHYLNSSNNIKYELIDINYIVILSLCNTIAITGDSGSGKTTISNIVKNIFNNSFLLECDRYHKWDRHDTNWNNYTHLNPDANYITKMCDDVFDLKFGNKIYQIDYDHKSGKFTDKELIKPCDNIIICGLHCLYMPENIINLKIYMDTDDNLRIPWKINRDINKRGYSIDKIYKQIKDRESDFNNYIYPQKELADIIISFYTNIIFDFKNYDIKNYIPFFLKIGIKSSYNLQFVYVEFVTEICKIEHIGNFIYIYFNYFENYENIIKNVIKNIITTN